MDSKLNSITFEELKDGRQRSRHILPDSEVVFTVEAAGYIDGNEMRMLPEGHERELTNGLRKSVS